MPHYACRCHCGGGLDKGNNVIAQIYNDGKKGWLLELATGNPVDGWVVVSATHYPSKLEAKRAARESGAQPWNY